LKRPCERTRERHATDPAAERLNLTPGERRSFLFFLVDQDNEKSRDRHDCQILVAPMHGLAFGGPLHGCDAQRNFHNFFLPLGCRLGSLFFADIVVSAALRLRLPYQKAAGAAMSSATSALHL